VQFIRGNNVGTALENPLDGYVILWNSRTMLYLLELDQHRG
jgi:hypothetical protein